MIVRHVAERPEAAWGQQVVTTTHERDRVGAQPIEETADEARLSGTCLAGDEDHDTVSLIDRRADVRLHPVQLLATLEQERALHLLRDRIIGPGRRS